jgi:predicted alpha/beta hydrolase family esterase
MLLTLLALIMGCGGSDDGDSDPVAPTGIAIQLDADEVNIGESVDLQAVFTTTGRDVPDIVWYVDDELGGSAEVGTIAAGNPTTYTAPDAEPVDGEVEIKAITNDDNEFEDYATLIVNGPVGVNLVFSALDLQVSEELTVAASLDWGSRVDDEFEWYVDDVLGGNGMVGMITQDNPATYSAPAVDGLFTIKAVSLADDALSAEEDVEVLFTIKHVDAAAGTDVAGGGSWDYPFRTITFALGETEEGDTVLVAPGVYDSDLGEGDFYSVREGITVRGVDRETCFVYGGVGSYTVFKMYEGSTVESVTVGSAGLISGGDLGDSAFNSGSTFTIRNVKINDYFDDAVIVLRDDDNYTLIEDCEFVNTHTPGIERAIEMTEDCHPIVRNCVITHWGQGIWANTYCDPLIEYCNISDNVTAITLYNGSGSETNADLGGGARGSLGNNVIQNNASHGIYCRNQTGTIYAMFNTWNTDPPTSGEEEGTDFYSIWDGAWVWH